MKKFYAMFVAVLMSATLFAQNAPTEADLAANYDLQNNVVLCVQFIDEATVCRDIRFVGSPNNWGKGEGSSEAFSNCEKFLPVAGFDGWYAAELAYSDGFYGKPIQETEDGAWSWDWQPGDPAAWVQVGTNAINITLENGSESSMGYPAAGAYIYQLKYWKNHKNPCVALVPHHYSIILYAPDACPDMKPGIAGDDMGWTAIAMTEDVDEDFETIYKYEFDGVEGHGFKFLDAALGWDNEMQYYVDTLDEWKKFDNIELTADSNLVFDFSDNDLYRFTLCTGEPIDTATYNVVIGVNVPAGAPAAGVELMGSWGEDTWTNGVVLVTTQTGWYINEFDIQAKAGNEFKFREAGTWDNEIVYVNQISEEGKAVGLKNFKFGDLWTDGDGKWEGKKVIELDLSDSTVYCWKANWVAPEQGIENVVLTEKAQKVMVDGVLYIIRDNKMYNLQGVMVRKD